MLAKFKGGSVTRGGEALGGKVAGDPVGTRAARRLQWRRGAADIPVVGLDRITRLQRGRRDPSGPSDRVRPASRAGRAFDDALDALQARLLAAAGPGSPSLAVAIGGFRRTADGLAREASLSAAGEAFAGSSLAVLASSGRVSGAGIAELLADAQRLTRAEPLPTALQALLEPAPLQAALDVALRTHVALIAGACGLADVAAWHVVPDGALTPSAASRTEAFDATRASVAKVFCVDPHDLPLTLVHDGDEPCAVIAWVPLDEDDVAPRVLSERSAAALAIAYQRANLAQAEIAEHAEVARSAKRRLARVAFDLHDGPLQDLALMRHELVALRRRLLESELQEGLGLAQLDDILAIADSTQLDLRELATSMTSSSLTQRPFDDALRGVARGFALRSALEPELTIRGDVDGLTSMERVALLRVVGEALANIREHSGAQHVVVAVTVGDSDVEAVIVDDGCGFDIQRTLPEAARRGSMGLLGMIERVRLMNGTWDVQSAEGQGTTIVVRFDRFFPEPAQVPQPGIGDVA